jgi:23S rRNA pseudouridine2604 synthase
MEKIRLSKLMSGRGLCSRREADRLIEKGLVRVDGNLIDTLGTRVDPHATIELAERARTELQGKVTIMLNKPIGHVSSQPEGNTPPAIRLIRPANRSDGDKTGIRFRRSHLDGLVPAGRLDIDSQGLLILTQDGRVARSLISPLSRVEKEYLVRIRQEIKEHHMKRLRYGLVLDGKMLRRAIVERQNRDQLKIVLTEGRKRQIRRMCKEVGLDVTGLKRVRVGRLRLGALPEGQWRYIDPDILLEPALVTPT